MFNLPLGDVRRRLRSKAEQVIGRTKSYACVAERSKNSLKDVFNVFLSRPRNAKGRWMILANRTKLF